MKSDKPAPDCCQPPKHLFKHHRCSCHDSNPIYGLGVVGALFYFLPLASGFSQIIMAIIKSIFWPAVLIFEVLTRLHL